MFHYIYYKWKFTNKLNIIRIIKIVLSRKNKLEGYELTRATFACIISVPRRSQAIWKNRNFQSPNLQKSIFYLFQFRKLEIDSSKSREYFLYDIVDSTKI